MDATSAAELWSATSRHDPRFAARSGTDLARLVVGPDLFITRVNRAGRYMADSVAGLGG